MEADTEKKENKMKVHIQKFNLVVCVGMNYPELLLFRRYAWINQILGQREEAITTVQKACILFTTDVYKNWGHAECGTKWQIGFLLLSNFKQQRQLLKKNILWEKQGIDSSNIEKKKPSLS